MAQNSKKSTEPAEEAAAPTTAAAAPPAAPAALDRSRRPLVIGGLIAAGALAGGLLFGGGVLLGAHLPPAGGPGVHAQERGLPGGPAPTGGRDRGSDDGGPGRAPQP